MVHEAETTTYKNVDNAVIGFSKEPDSDLEPNFGIKPLFPARLLKNLAAHHLQ